jgi:hypothetical protein
MSCETSQKSPIEAIPQLESLIKSPADYVPAVRRITHVVHCALVTSQSVLRFCVLHRVPDYQGEIV